MICGELILFKITFIASADAATGLRSDTWTPNHLLAAQEQGPFLFLTCTDSTKPLIRARQSPCDIAAALFVNWGSCLLNPELSTFGRPIWIARGQRLNGFQGEVHGAGDHPGRPPSSTAPMIEGLCRARQARRQ